MTNFQYTRTYPIFFNSKLFTLDTTEREIYAILVNYHHLYVILISNQYEEYKKNFLNIQKT